MELKPLKGRHIKKGFKLLLETGNAPENDPQAQVNAVEKLQDYIESVACEISGLTEEELNDLPNDTKREITDKVKEAIQKEMDFVKASR